MPDSKTMSEPCLAGIADGLCCTHPPCELTRDLVRQLRERVAVLEVQAELFRVNPAAALDCHVELVHLRERAARWRAKINEVASVMHWTGRPTLAARLDALLAEGPA